MHNTERFGFSERIEILNGDAVSVLDEISKDSERKYDFVFIDASKSHYREFFEKAEKMCSKGAVIVCDNILLKASIVDNSYDPHRRHRTNIKRMKEFLSYLKNRKDLTVSYLSSGDGLAIIRLNDEK